MDSNSFSDIFGDHLPIYLTLSDRERNRSKQRAMLGKPDDGNRQKAVRITPTRPDYPNRPKYPVPRT